MDFILSALARINYLYERNMENKASLNKKSIETLEIGAHYRENLFLNRGKTQ